MSFGERLGALIRQKRGERAWSQENLADAAFGDPTRKGMISQLENGRIRNPQQRTVARITEVLEISGEEINTCRSTNEKNIPRAVQSVSSVTEGASETLKTVEVQRNLGLALMEQSRMIDDPGSLQEAIEVFRMALTQATRENAPQQWAATQNSLGLALMEWGRINDDPRSLQEAIEAFRMASDGL